MCFSDIVCGKTLYARFIDHSDPTVNHTMCIWPPYIDSKYLHVQFQMTPGQQMIYVCLYVKKHAILLLYFRQNFLIKNGKISSENVP